MSYQPLYIGNDNTVAFDLLDVNRSPALGGTMSVTLYSGATGTVTVTGQTWPLALAESETSPGTYSGVLVKALAITAGQVLRLVITAQHEGSEATWENLFTGAVRRAPRAVAV